MNFDDQHISSTKNLWYPIKNNFWMETFVIALDKKQYQVKIFLTFYENMCCGYSVEVPQ